MATSFRLILASSSPQRHELLQKAGYAHEVVPPEVVEPPTQAFRSAAGYTQHAAWLKAADVAERLKAAGGGQESGTLILAADSVVAIGSEIIGKPLDRADAQRILQRLSGTRHEVVTSVCLWRRPEDFYVGASERSRLRMRRLSEDQIEAYLDSGDWAGKAGAYGVQQIGDAFMDEISGSFSNVVGLPLELLARLWAAFPQLTQ